MSLLRGLPPQRRPGTSLGGGTEAEGTAPASCVWPRRSRKPRRRVVFWVLLARGTSSTVTRFWRWSPSLRKIVAPVCRLGKYPLRPPSSHELSLLPPGHQPLPTRGLRVVWFVFFFSPPAACRALVKRGAQPGSAWFEDEKGVLSLVWFFFLPSVSSSAGMALAFHPRDKIIHRFTRGIRSSQRPGDCSPRR